MKTIHVSDEVWEALLKLKAEMRARSMDDVLRRILSQVVKIPPGQNTDLSTGQAVQVPTGQVTKVSRARQPPRGVEG
jgi:negative regulator of replication initiation